MSFSRTLTEQKKATLISRLSILIFVLTTFNMVLDWVLHIHVQSWIYLAFIALSIVIFFLNRRGHTHVAKVVGLFSFNSMIFIVASSEPNATGMYLYFIASAAVALTIYNYEEWRKAMSFAALSTVLFVLVYTDLNVFSIIEERAVNADEAKYFFFINVAVNSVICVYSFLLYSKLNYQAENSLRSNELLMLEQNSQLEKANQELDKFVYSVSHDLRAPLSSISGLIQLVEKSDNPVETKQFVELMKSRVERLEQFIREIINFSRNQRTDVQWVEINLRELVNETVEALKFIDGAEQMTIENNLPPTTTVCADRTRLEMILANIISNAIQYRNANKENSFLRFACEQENDEVAILIDDNGIGIDPAHQANVFNMFYRATEKSKGSGLGLYIVKEAVEKLGGSIRLHSVLGDGTRFVVRFHTRPMNTAQVAAASIINSN